MRPLRPLFALGMLFVAHGQSAAQSPRALYQSPVVTAETRGGVEIDVDLRGARELYLVVTDAGDGHGCDWANWVEPKLIGPDGARKLTGLNWKSASAGWGQVRIGRNASGGPLVSEGETISDGIGTHANSVIAYDLPEGVTRFTARGVLDDGGTRQGCGSTVRFAVYSQNPGQARSGEELRDPEAAVESLEVAEGLQAALFASEPMISSPSQLDIDHLGRVWLADVQNYRGRQGTRPEGDRILILEDTTGDGAADKVTTFYQGNDIDSLLGLTVLGNKVIVACSPNVFVFYDDNGDGKADRKELLFTNTGRRQHDHSAHQFQFGPDGKLYWNFGDTGGRVHDAEGNPVVDIMGHEVTDAGRPYRKGMAFRCNPDGTRFEVLGHNFRNPYELTVDSFGGVWQSDNDDDGNRACRINFLLEGGNYGYTDELTGAGWQSARTAKHPDNSLAHWHVNDPGVVPNLLDTGAGSPSGITMYEGTLLPEVFRNQMIHAEPGANVVRAYPVQPDGAGYRAEIENLLHSTRDRWFRPVAVRVAPDGSLFVADWYDPGVGGHNKGDLYRGRVFRVAPPGHEYRVPEFDFDTPAGAAEALKNPNQAVRYLAWTALHAMGTEAVAALESLYASENPRHRARGLWLLSKIEDSGPRYIERALADADADLRITALRAARQLDLDIMPYLRRAADDASPRVRREVLIALRYRDAAEAAPLWARLAERHEAEDAWYREALGIAADGRWDACLEAWLERVGDAWNTPAGHEILWRSRAERTPAYLARIIRDPQTDEELLPLYLRAFDFLAGETKQSVLLELAFAAAGDDPRGTYISTEALRRLPPLDIAGNPEHAGALSRTLDHLDGSLEFIQLVGRFETADRYPAVLAIAQRHPRETLGVEAVKMLLAKGQHELLSLAAGGEEEEAALATIEALGTSRENGAVEVLLPLVEQRGFDPTRRRAAVRAMTASAAGAQRVVELARQDRLEPALRSAAAVPLATTPYRQLHEEIARLFPPPEAAEGTPLPPLPELLRLRGNAEAGRRVYMTVGTCAKCHVAQGEGKTVGPDLSGIGRKLTRQGLYESILFPNAGISHSYETYTAELDNGTILTGIMTSETPEEVTLRDAEAIDRAIPRERIEVLTKQDVSLMPDNLQNQMTLEQLADLVEWLTTLQQAEE